jgi:hypothetical protein
MGEEYNEKMFSIHIPSILHGVIVGGHYHLVGVGGGFYQISTWKIWFWPIQRIFHEKMAQILKILKKKNPKLLDFDDKF